MPPNNGATIVATLKARFEQHPERHRGMSWSQVHARLDGSPGGRRALEAMEKTGGEPDVVGIDEATGAIVFMDCSAESPAGRRSLCYDRAALDARKENKPAGAAVEMAEAMGIELLTEQEYRFLQTLGEFDRKTSSWVKTPAAIRKLKGAVFCDRRYDHVFYYHNGAESYYAARGFRGVLRV